MGLAYTQVGELEKATDALNKVVELSAGDENMKNSALNALQEVKRRGQRDNKKEKEMLQRMFKPKPNSKAMADFASGSSDQIGEKTEDIQLEKLISDRLDENTTSSLKAAGTIVTNKTYFQIINEWIWWTIFLPITVPLEVTKFFIRKTFDWTFFTILTLWSCFCVATLFMAAIAVYVPVIGDRVANLFLIPSKIDRIPQ